MSQPQPPSDHTVPNAATPPGVGSQIGPYRLDRLINVGGMGMVYAGTDTRLNRPVAVKLVLASMAQSQAFLARFEREASIMARLESPHVIAVYDHGQFDGWPYLVSQYAAGGDLGELLRERGPLSGPVAADICAQVADGLAAAHAVGVVHRDVKPANVLLRDDRLDRPHAYLGDFGVAHTDSSGLTQPGSVAGTWNYLAPERAAGDPGSPASDIYALGCLFYETLTGRAPYAGSDVEVALAHLREPVPQLPGNGDFTRRANVVLARVLAKDPADRPSSAVDVRDQLRLLSGRDVAFAAGPSVKLRGRRRGRVVAAGVAAAVLVAALAGGGVWWATSGSDDSPSDGHSTKAGPGVTGDLDGDGKGDLLWGEGGGTGIQAANDTVDSTPDTFFTSTGTGFAAGPALTPDPATLIGDVDGDGVDDVIQVSGTSSSFQVSTSAKGQARGLIKIPNTDRVLGAFAADLDGDGRVDVGLASVGDGKDLDFADTDKINDLTFRITVIRSLPDGSWQWRKRWLQIPFHGSVYGVTLEAGDLDGDGKDDLIFGDEYGKVVESVLHSTGSTLERLSTPAPDVGDLFEPTSSLADVDGDGTADLVVTSSTSIDVFDLAGRAWRKMPGWSVHWQGAAGTLVANPPAISDLDGDGQDDLAFGLTDMSTEKQKLLPKFRVYLAGADGWEHAADWDAPGAAKASSQGQPLRSGAWEK